MPRKSNWKNNKTKAIRVPENLADELLRLARAMEDQIQIGFVQNEPTEAVMVSLQGKKGDRRTVIAAPISIWQEADALAEETLLHPGIQNLTPSQRSQLALLLAERLFTKKTV